MSVGTLSASHSSSSTLQISFNDSVEVYRAPVDAEGVDDSSANGIIEWSCPAISSGQATSKHLRTPNDCGGVQKVRGSLIACKVNNEIHVDQRTMSWTIAGPARGGGDTEIFRHSLDSET